MKQSVLLAAFAISNVQGFAPAFVGKADLVSLRTYLLLVAILSTREKIP